MENDQILDTESTPSEASGGQSPPAVSGDAPGDKTDECSASSTTEEEDVRLQMARMNEEIQMYKDRWIRLAAEFDNYKKRTNREFTALVKNANALLIAQLLPVLDNLERALQAPHTTEETKSFAQGVEMISQQLLETLRKEGLQEIETTGQPFDPTRHEAVLAVDREDQPAQTILDVVEKGYMLNERVIRPAKVTVARQPASEQP